MRRALIGVLAVLLSTAAAPAQAAQTPKWAQDGGWLPRREAQQGATWFASQTAPLLDLPEYANQVTEHVAAPSKCHRRNNATVLCWFSVHLASQPIVLTGFMRVHFQRNGLLGYYLPWDPLKVGLGWY